MKKSFSKLWWFLGLKVFLLTALFSWLMLGNTPASHAANYDLSIDYGEVHIDGSTRTKILINQSLPGPTLNFREGEEVVIRVSNHLDVNTSIHWHGLLLPGEMDGVPGFNGFNGIAPGETFTYRFTVRQAGTYWYHAHSKGQEQDGVYGSIVIRPSKEDPIPVDRDYVVLLSEYHQEDSSRIMANLKMSAEYYQYARRTVGDFFSDAKQSGLGDAWSNAKMWGRMRMLPTDLSDVTGYTFLINGQTPDQNWTALFKPGERVRLRFINASAMSFYDVRIPGLKMQLISSDGQNVEPVEIDEFRFGVAETYDVIVTPDQEKAYTIVAEPIDRSGFALASLAPRSGMKGAMPTPRPRALLTMADMGQMGNMAGMEGMDHSAHKKSGDHNGQGDHSEMDHHSMHRGSGEGIAQTNSGWANASTPVGDKALSYADLRYLGEQADQRPPGREIVLRLGGNMERYLWTINGKKYNHSSPINLRYGERVRLKFINETMMAHPMHLHGMFVQLDNGQPMAKLPNKHTVIVQPGKAYSVLLTADEVGEWTFHCHLLYHMMAGMMNKVVVARLDADELPSSSQEGHNAD